MNHETMRLQGFSPYGPSKAALESETIIWSQDLAETGVTVNALLPGGAALTGMIPYGVPDHIRSQLLDPSIVVPPLLWLASSDSNGITVCRFVATKWQVDRSGRDAAKAAMDPAGWRCRVDPPDRRNWHPGDNRGIRYTNGIDVTNAPRLRQGFRRTQPRVMPSRSRG